MSPRGGRRKTVSKHSRIKIVRYGFFAILGVFALRLFFLQILQGGFYKALAEGQHGFYAELFAQRGDILVRDWVDGDEYAVATMEPSGLVYTDPRRVEDPENTAIVISRLLGYSLPSEADIAAFRPADIATPTSAASVDQLALRLLQPAIEPAVEEENSEGLENVEVENVGPTFEEEFDDYLTLLARLQKEDDPYEPIERNVRADIIERIDELDLPGIYTTSEIVRAYPEKGISGQLTGFLGMNDSGDRVGLYGIEGYFDEFLRGSNGFLDSVKDASGVLIGIGGRAFERAQDGGDLLLTVDRTIQYEACKRIQEGVEQYEADSGVVIVAEPETGRIIAMCSYPNFDPAFYSKVESATTFQNMATSYTYEPGSVMKPLVMAAAIDQGVIRPTTTYTDTGSEKIDRFTIMNSDKESHGLQTMTQVLEKSLNTGMIFVMRKMGFDPFQKYMKAYGFGERTGLTISGEAAGTIESLDVKSEIYYATASFGQGVTVTPLQLVMAYSAIANGGYLMRPYIIEEKRYSDNSVEIIRPKLLRQVLSEDAARQTGAMMVSVVEEGHAKAAAIDGYYIAGKTGTAQVPRTDGPGYDPNHTKATFAGFAPLDNPQFAMIVMLDHPRTSPWADSTAAPVWRGLAEFMLQYFEVTPQR
jgi:stage V sporulation protein D (sporulation-specific penicillin-binding protein)